MKHRLWDERDVQAMTSTDVANEHNLLFMAHEDQKARRDTAEKRAMETMDENNRLDRELDELHQQAKANASHDEFWNVGNIMALGAREVVKRHEEDMKAARPAAVTDEQIEKMARAHMGVISPCANWEHADKQYYMNAIRAALGAIGPQYCPSDVGFASRVPELEAKIQRQRMSLRELHHARQLEAGERLRLEQDLKNERHKANRFDATAQELSKIIDDQKRDEDSLRSSLARVTSERDTLRAQLAILHPGETVEGVVLERDSYRLEIERLRDALNAARQTVPMRVRWDVTAEQMTADIGYASQLPLMKTAMDYLAAHAVIDAPAGVPSVEELVKSLYPVIEENSGDFMRDGLSPSWYAWVELLVTETLAALAPYLHEPTGWELDVTELEARKVYLSILEKDLTPMGMKWTYSADALQAVLNLCRSRIRPTFECQECAKARPETRVANEVLRSRINAARAALEGE